MRPIMPPIYGAANDTTFKATPAGFAPVGRLLNVDVFNADGDRPQMGKRRGLAKLVPARIGSGPVMGLCSVQRASVVTGYAVGTCTPHASGTTLEAGAITGNYWMLDTVPAMIRDGFLDVTGLGGTAANACNAVTTWETLQTDGSATYALIAVSTNYTVAGKWQATIRVFRSDTGATVATATISHAIDPRRINSMHWGRNFLFVCVENFLYVYRQDLTLVDSYHIEGWASEVVQCDSWWDGTNEYLMVGFNGADSAATVTNASGTFMIDAGNAAIQFRSGIRKYRVDQTYTSAVGPYGSSEVLTPVDFGQAFDGAAVNNASWTYFETYHQYFRFSEWSRVRPWGCLVQGVAVDDDGNVLVARTNTGYGPNSSFSPDVGITGRITVCKISAAGAMVGEWDVDSVVEVGMAGFYNDINNPTLEGIDTDAAGDVYVGGRQNAAGFSAWKLRGASGARAWSINLQTGTGKIRQGSVRVDRNDGHVVLAGDRNSAWDGSGGNNANFWKRDATTGDALQSFDLGAAVSGLGVAVTAQGEYVYVSDKV